MKVEHTAILKELTFSLFLISHFHYMIYYLYFVYCVLIVTKSESATTLTIEPSTYLIFWENVTIVIIKIIANLF
jgi:hypothetical protein